MSETSGDASTGAQQHEKRAGLKRPLAIETSTGATAGAKRLRTPENEKAAIRIAQQAKYWIDAENYDSLNGVIKTELKGQEDEFYAKIIFQIQNGIELYFGKNFNGDIFADIKVIESEAIITISQNHYAPETKFEIPVKFTKTVAKR